MNTYLKRFIDSWLFADSVSTAEIVKWDGNITVNSEKVMIWKETVVTIVCLEKMRKTMES